VSKIKVKRLDKTLVAFKCMFSVLNYRSENTSADLTFQSEDILRAGADELRTQQAST